MLTMLPPPPLRHEGHGPPGEEEVTLHVEVEDRVVGLLVGIQEVECPRDACVVDQRVEAPEGFCSSVHGPLARFDLAQVALYRDGLAAEFFYPRYGLLGLGVGVVDRDFGAAAGQLDGDALADTHASTRYQRLLPREVAHRSTPAPSRFSQPSEKRLKWTSRLGLASITSSSSSTPRPGPFGQLEVAVHHVG